MQALSYVTLDLLRPGMDIVYAAQNDSGTRGVVVTLLSGSVPFTPPAGTIAMIEVRKPDNTHCVYDTLDDGETPAYTIIGNTITVLWAAQALAVSGNAKAAIRLYNASEQRLTSYTFRLVIPEGACPDDTLTSSDYYNILTRQIAGVLGAATHPPRINTTTHTWELWDQTANDYVNSGESCLGEPGPPEVPATTISYQAGTSPTTAPVGTWQTAPPAVPAGGYLWTRTVLSYSDGTTATSYSVAYQGQNGGGTQITTYTGKSVAASDWTLDTAPTYADYPYHADVLCNGVTVSDYALTTFAPADAASGILASVCDTDTDTVRIYAAEPVALTIPMIAVWR